MKSTSTARTSITGRAKNLSLVPNTHKTPKSRNNVLNFQNFWHENMKTAREKNEIYARDNDFVPR